MEHHEPCCLHLPSTPRRSCTPYCNRTAIHFHWTIPLPIRTRSRPPQNPDHLLVAPKGAGSSPVGHPQGEAVGTDRKTSKHKAATRFQGPLNAISDAISDAIIGYDIG